MTRVELKLPNFDLPGITASVCAWYAAVGERVVEGDRVVEILAGDVTIDLPAPVSGVLLERRAAVDQPLKDGDCVAVIDEL